MNTNVQYRFAFDTDNQVVDINDLTTADRQDYQCASCGTVLRPVLGEHRQKHFRHKALVDCSEETYLHRIGKFLFKQEYQTCLENGIPFLIKYLCPRVCNSCPDFGPCKVASAPVSHDLTQFFKTIELEKPDGGFVPDLLLTTGKGEKLYVEIAVSHLSETAKRDSDVRIIELTINCENDLSLIRQHELSNSDPRVEFINFQIKIKLGPFSDACLEQVHAFVLFPTGKSRVKTVKRSIFKETFHKRNLYHSVTQSLDPKDFFTELEKAYLSGHLVKNCYLCRYHLYKEKQVWELRKHFMYCKFLKTYKNSNDAVTCEAYRPDKMAFESNRNHLGH